LESSELYVIPPRKGLDDIIGRIEADLAAQSAHTPKSSCSVDMHGAGADSDLSGHAFRYEGGHLFRFQAGQCSDLMSATSAMLTQVW
jgi:hypothetical protein